MTPKQLRRFNTKFQVDPVTFCWTWMAAKDQNGYGVVRIDGTLHKAHRVSYRLLVGPIPDGLHVDHLCRVRNCINPAHLEAVTREVNNSRRVYKRDMALQNGGTDNG